MEDYDCLINGCIDHVSDCHCTLEECNKEQQSICKEVLESLIAINQRTLLSFRISDGSFSAVDVGQLLFEDIFELSRHLQSGVEEHVKSYKEILEKTNEDHLYNLQTNISVLQHSSKDAKKRLLNWKKEPQEIKDLREYLSLTTRVIHSIKECEFLGNSCIKQIQNKMKEHREMLNVDIYQQYVTNYYRTIEACNTEQRLFSNEIIEALKAIHEEKLSAFHISVESNDAVNVQQLLFEDVFEFSRHLQPGVEEHVQSYQQRLQGANEEQLNDLLRRVSMLPPSLMNPKEVALGWKMMEQEMKDLTEYLSLTTSIIRGLTVCRTQGNSCLKKLQEKMKEHREILTVDTYKQYVTNYYRTIEACNTEQRLFSNEIIEALKTIHEEKLSAFHISVGSNDAVNVQQLLFEDVFEFSRHLQPGVEEHVQSYQQRLQEANEDQLYDLLRRVSMLPPSSMNPKEVALGWKMMEQEMKDLTEYLSLTTSIIRGLTVCRTQGNSCLKKLQEKLKEHRELLTYQEELRTVNEINKRNLGMMIIRHVGHEGSEDKYGLRRLLQTCIDFLPTRTADVWRNASITIYDEDDNMFKIGSGEMKHQYICQMSNGEPYINDRMSVSSGSTYMHRAEKTDEPSKQRSMEKCYMS